MTPSKSRLSMMFWIALGIFILGVLAVGLGKTLLPLFLSFAAAYLILPLVVWLEKKGLPRTPLALSFLLLFTAFCVGVLIVVIPRLLSEARLLALALPDILDRLIQLAQTQADRLNLDTQFDKESLKAYVTSHLSEVVESALGPMGGILKGLAQNTLQALVIVLNFVLFPVFFYYFLHDYSTITSFLSSLVPKPYKAKARSYSEKLTAVLSGYIRGQLLVCLCLSGLYSLGFSLAGVPFGFLLGLIAGGLSLVPYLGAGSALIGAPLLALIYDSSLSVYIGALIVWAGAQGLEGFILTPRLVGNRVGLSPLASILALIIGANLFGFLGMLLAIPTAGMLKIIGGDLVKAYQESPGFQG